MLVKNSCRNPRISYGFQATQYICGPSLVDSDFRSPQCAHLPNSPHPLAAPFSTVSDPLPSTRNLFPYPKTQIPRPSIIRRLPRLIFIQLRRALCCPFISRRVRPPQSQAGKRSPSRAQIGGKPLRHQACKSGLRGDERGAHNGNIYFDNVPVCSGDNVPCANGKIARVRDKLSCESRTALEARTYRRRHLWGRIGCGSG